MQNKWLPWIIFITLSIIWGSSFILMKKGLIAFSPEQVAALRLSIAFACMIPWGWKYLRKLPKKDLLPIAAVGWFGNGFPAFLFTFAETEVSSSIVGILNATVPLFTLIIGMVFFGIKQKKNQGLGVLLGLAGALWLIFPEGIQTDGPVNIPYASLVLIATCCYAISANTIKQYLQHLPPVQITTIGLGFAGIPAVIYLFSTDFIQRLTVHQEGYSSFGYTFILAFFGTSVGVVLFNILIQKSSAVFASSVTYLIPIVAIFWGVMDGESLSIFQLFAVIVIILGLYLVNKPKKKIKISHKSIAGQ